MKFEGVLDFGAKVRWRMRRDRRPLLAVLQDKLAVRHYAAERGVATAPLLHVSDRPADIPFDELPTRYMIKANHGCAWNIMGHEGELFTYADGRRFVEPGSEGGQTPLTREQAVSLCDTWLASRYSQREWAYTQIPPKILVEAWLTPSDGPSAPLRDYRLYTFNGRVRAVSLGSAEYRRDGINVFLTPDWEPVALSRYTEALPNQMPLQPACWPEMLAAAQRLGSGLDFARIDLYDTDQGVMLGETTMYPQAGEQWCPSGCAQFNRSLARHWPLGFWSTAEALLAEGIMRYKSVGLRCHTAQVSADAKHTQAR